MTPTPHIVVLVMTEYRRTFKLRDPVLDAWLDEQESEAEAADRLMEEQAGG